MMSVEMENERVLLIWLVTGKKALRFPVSLQDAVPPADLRNRPLSLALQGVIEQGVVNGGQEDRNGKGSQHAVEFVVAEVGTRNVAFAYHTFLRFEGPEPNG